jgi:hypothetical protein
MLKNKERRRSLIHCFTGEGLEKIKGKKELCEV